MKENREHTILWVAFTVMLLGLLVWAAQPVSPAQAGSTLPSRVKPCPVQPDKDDDDDDNPVGAHIELMAPTGAWSVVQWQDNSGGWHDVEGWTGSLADGGGWRWWVEAKDFGTGPFRWVSQPGPEGSVLNASGPFTLPAFPNETVQVELK